MRRFNTGKRRPPKSSLFDGFGRLLRLFKGFSKGFGLFLEWFSEPFGWRMQEPAVLPREGLLLRPLCLLVALVLALLAAPPTELEEIVAWGLVAAAWASSAGLSLIAELRHVADALAVLYLWLTPPGGHCLSA